MRKYDEFRDRDWLYSKYWDEGLTQEEIAHEVGCTTPTISIWMRDFGILTRSGADARVDLKNADYRNEDWLRAQYSKDGATLNSVAYEAGCAEATILRWMKIYGIERRGAIGPQARREECVVCGEALPPYKRKYCSDECGEVAKRAYQQNRRERLKNAPSDALCKHCRKPLNILQAKRGYEYCSRQCAQMANATLKGALRECVICGKPFEPYHQDQICCSSRCGSLYAAQNTAKPPQVTIACGRCGKKIVIREYTGAISPKFCEECYHEKERDRKRARRALKAQLPTEEINERDVYERDGWVCQICGEPIDPNCKWPDSQSPSIDHVVPISMGGHHVMSNVQASHLGCNCSKGNRYEGAETEADSPQTAFGHV